MINFSYIANRKYKTTTLTFQTFFVETQVWSENRVDSNFS
jgi:hypothetical protein